MELARKHTERLEEIKSHIEQSYEYWRDNNDRYTKFIKFVFNTALSSEDRDKLAVLQKPALEFNILEAMVSRLLGEFSKQEPSVNVRAADGIRPEDLTPELVQTIEVIEAHLREIFFNATNDSLEYKIYCDLLGGGFSVIEVFTEYVNEVSFEQNIKVDKVFDNTLVGFDPLARDSHKGDGQFCFKIVPRTRKEFEEEFGKSATKNMKFTRGFKNSSMQMQQNNSLCSFNWTYKNQDQEIILIADYFCKERKKTKIVKLSNGHTTTRKAYDLFLAEWEAQGFIEQPPAALEERWTYLETIERYTLCENQMLAHAETDYGMLPLVFVDGHSVTMRNETDGSSYQMIRPYVYHAEGVQRLKNFSGQTIGAEIENMVQHKFKVSAEAIPEMYEEAYKNVQQADVLVYNAFYKDDPTVPLQPPMEIQRTATPPIVENTFLGTDRTTQTILGSYDSLLGTNSQQVSGVAIQQGAMQSNAAAIPYLTGYIQGMNRVAQIIIDLIPKYYVTPRSLPIRKSNGKRDYQIINHPRAEGSIKIDYDPRSLQVKLEAGVNTSVQKQVALEQIIRMMQASPLFAQFINTDGLETILDNMDIRGIDGLKEQAVEFMKQLKEQQEAQAGKQDPMIEVAAKQVENELQIETARIQQRQQEAEGNLSIQAARVAVEEQKAELAYLELMSKVEQGIKKSDLEEQRLQSENARTAVESAISIAQAMHHEDRGITE
jgi:hypothetical protein